ncbi:Ion transport 2 domain protein [Ferrimonas balearica DSM 9799]|uniref:Ion transport 2 domain protein n=1 Tax=Ferrimonas balearica (strain DSM 9799 / CCM 4581 / KCTC 23876 / PAT) TaxID=550540 RepID=E1SUH5_FERBD|nr:potassium channel family protein [Ferrimonas balearica]MBY6017785.1 potassium channel family protein [Halomonas denitrificans]ADN77282.1 Ion transport 2 domain protein [Ferrimonas balearica DSM 9799]MBW3139725.1 potassium channel family protein [Ferrimonas balearica]MBW3164749.1 potassium channel family protein [Ferrimonas balearica]MBY5980387.1 potassium channel family protein [Ferrimonas balearica]
MRSKITQDNNFFFLTGALIILLLSSALEQVLSSGLLEEVLQLLTLLTFAVCLTSLKFEPGWSRFLMLLVAAWVFLALLKRWLHIGLFDLMGLTLMLMFFLGTLKACARQILFTGGPITGNQVVGSLALFLLLGLVWALIYLVILEFSPEAFSGLEPRPWQDNLNRAIYFSFVTLTTLGYGEITPTNAFAQAAVYLEAIIGTFYLAVVVASLVSAKQAEP